MEHPRLVRRGRGSRLWSRSMKRDFCLLGQHPGLCRWVPRGPQWGGDDGGRSVNSGSRRPLVGPQTKTSHTVLCPSSWPDIKRSGPGPALWGRPPHPISHRATSFNVHTSPVSGKCKFLRGNPHSTGPPTHYGLSRDIAMGAKVGAGHGTGSRRYREDRRARDTAGEAAATRHGVPGVGSMAGSTDRPPTARQRGRSSRRPAGTAGSPGDQAGGRRLAVLGRLRVPP